MGNGKSGPTLGRRSAVKLGVATAAAAALPLGPAFAQKEPLKVGVMGGYTGHLSATATSARRGITLFGKMINDAGGVGGHKIELDFFDTQSKVENARTGAEKLIGDGATILIGAGDSGATIAALQVAEQAKVPLVVDIAAAPQITEQGYKYIFRNFPDGISLVRDAVKVIKDLTAAEAVKPKTAVLLHINDTFGQSIANGVKALWGRLEMPIEIIDMVAYDPKARDLSAEVAKVKSLKPDLLMPVTRVLDAIQIVREMVKQDFTPMAIIGPGSPGPFEKEFTEALGKYGDYYMVSTPWYDPTTEETKKARAGFAKVYPDYRFELNVGFAYEAGMIVADAFRRAGSTESAALHEALRATAIKDHVIFGGPIQFNEKGHNPNIGSVMLQNRDKEPKVVLPARIAEAKPVIPIPKWSERG